MCFTLIQYRTLDEAPVLVAFNREEFFKRQSMAPAVQPGDPQVLCATDREAGGTWLGVNENGLFVAVTNRLKPLRPQGARSRGLLCLDLLRCRSAGEAVELAVVELETGRYAGANYICADAQSGTVVQSGQRLEVVELEPGRHLLTNCDLDDCCDERQAHAWDFLGDTIAASVADFLSAARDLCSLRADGSGRPGIVRRGLGVGTVSSTLVALARQPEQSIYHYANGAPDEHPYEDYSPALQQLLGQG